MAVINRQQFNASVRSRSVRSFLIDRGTVYSTAQPEATEASSELTAAAKSVHIFQGDLSTSCAATGSKGGGFEPGQGDEFLRAIKILSTPSFGWEIKPEVPCRNILRHVKYLLKSHGDG
jgi:hypothetical protein